MMMFRRAVIVVAAALPLCAALPVFAADAGGDPEAWVLEISTSILDQIRNDSRLARADPARVRQFVDETVMPVVDFLRMTRMAVGPKWRQATAQQREELQGLFRDQLIKVYSGALATVRDQEVRLAPTRQKPTGTDALVRTLLVTPGKPDVRLNYRLKKVGDQWRIIDVEVEGIWLVDNYRNQFSSIANSRGIEGLIEALREKVAQSGSR